MCGRQEERKAATNSRKWWRGKGKGEVKAANEGREMTVIQPLLPYNLKQCVMELSSSPSSLPPSPFFTPCFLALRCPPPARRRRSVRVREQLCLRDRQLYPTRIEEVTAAAVSLSLPPSATL